MKILELSHDIKCEKFVKKYSLQILDFELYLHLRLKKFTSQSNKEGD